MTKASLSSCYTTNTGVHLTQLISESAKVSIHAFKLSHDDLQGHITSRGRRRSGGWNSKSCRTGRLHTWLLQSKLSLTLPNRTGFDETHGGVVRRNGNGNGKVAKDPRDSRRKDELIMGRRILIDIEDKSDEMRGEVKKERSSKREKRKQARGSVIELL